MNWISFLGNWPTLECRYLLWDTRINSFVAAELRGTAFHVDNGKIVTQENNLFFSHYAVPYNPTISEIGDWKKKHNL